MVAKNPLWQRAIANVLERRAKPPCDKRPTMFAMRYDNVSHRGIPLCDGEPVTAVSVTSRLTATICDNVA